MIRPTIIILNLILITTYLKAQVPQAFNYQAVIRDNSGEVMYNSIADFKMEIVQADSIIYTEDHLDKDTGVHGVVSFQVGNGVNRVGEIADIEWSAGDIRLVIYLKVNGGQQEQMGSSEILPVPYALYAENAKDDADWNLLNRPILGDNLIWRKGSVLIGQEVFKFF